MPPHPVICWKGTSQQQHTAKSSLANNPQRLCTRCMYIYRDMALCAVRSSQFFFLRLYAIVMALAVMWRRDTSLFGAVTNETILHAIQYSSSNESAMHRQCVSGSRCRSFPTAGERRKNRNSNEERRLRKKKKKKKKREAMNRMGMRKRIAK